MAFILTVSNQARSIYEIANIVSKNEQFYVINDINDIFNIINERYALKLDSVFCFKIINALTNEQLTFEISSDCVHRGLYVKRSNPLKNILYNVNSNFVHFEKDFRNFMPLTRDNLTNIAFVKDFFNNY